MKLTGSYKLNVKKEIVWEALNNPEILKQCIPGCDSFEKENDSTFNASATNQIGPMNATFSGAVKLSNIKENHSYTLSGEGHSSVGFAKPSTDQVLMYAPFPSESSCSITLFEKSATLLLASQYNFIFVDNDAIMHLL